MQKHTDINESEQFTNGRNHIDLEKERLRFWLEMVSSMTFAQQLQAIESIYISLLRLRADARMIALIRAAMGAQDSPTICLLVDQMLNQPYFRNS